MSAITDKIDAIKAIYDEYYGESIPNPISQADLSKFKKEYYKFFKVKIDDEYIAFLKICDGIEEAGIKILSSKDREVNGVIYGIIENNKMWYEAYEGFQDYIFFASSGLDFFVFNKKTKKYELRDRHGGDMMETFGSFNEMLLYILDLMIGK